MPRVAAVWPSPCSLSAGCAGFYAGARHGVVRGGTCVCCLGRRRLCRRRARFFAGCAGFYAGARHGLARGGTCVLPPEAVAWPSLYSLYAGCAGFHAAVCRARSMRAATRRRGDSPREGGCASPPRRTLTAAAVARRPDHGRGATVHALRMLDSNIAAGSLPHSPAATIYIFQWTTAATRPPISIPPTRSNRD